MLRNINDFDQVDGPWLGTSTNVRTNCSQIHPAPADSTPADYPSFDELALRIAVAFRQHGHIGNVLTHICGRDWTGLEHDLCRILDPKSVGAELSPLARNVLELLCANRGVTA